MELENSLVSSAQDAPAILDEEDGERIAEFIRGSLAGHFQTESDRHRKAPMNMVPDIRVDVCLYLLGANHISTVDVAALQAIGGCVPVVPLLAKVLLSSLRTAPYHSH